MKKFDAKVLFEKKRSWQRPGYTSYRSIYDEIDAVHARKKALSIHWPLRDWLETQDFVDSTTYAHDRGLMVVLDPYPNEGMPRRLQPIRAFILRCEEMWRIPAIRALNHLRMGDAVKSTLFGYSEKQIKAYLKDQQWCRPAGTYGYVYYTLLTKPQRDEVTALGNKAFRDPIALTFYECGLEMKRDAFSRVPKQLTVARFLLAPKLGWQIVGDKSKRRLVSTVFSGDVTRKLAPLINRGLQSPIEFLGRRGWSAG